MDRFPEAFERFEERVDTREIKSFQQLKLSFSSWSGQRWHATAKQMEALRRESLRLGLKDTPKEPYYPKKPVEVAKVAEWRREIHVIRGKPQERWRDLKTGRFIRKPF